MAGLGKFRIHYMDGRVQEVVGAIECAVVDRGDDGRSYELSVTMCQAVVNEEIVPALARTAASLVREHLPLRCHVEGKDEDMSMHCHCAIVGARFHPGAADALRHLDQRWDMISTGRGLAKVKDRLTLKREPDNAHDPNAVAVYWLDRMLGYLPRQDAKVVARVMDNGIEVRAVYNGQAIAGLWWPASTKEDLDVAYRRAMREGEGI